MFVVFSEVSVWPTAPPPGWVCKYTVWPHSMTHLGLSWCPASRMKSSLWSNAELHNMYYSTFLSSVLYFYLPRRWYQIGTRCWGVVLFFLDICTSALGRSSHCPFLFSHPPYSAFTPLCLSFLIPPGFLPKATCCLLQSSALSWSRFPSPQCHN